MGKPNAFANDAEKFAYYERMIRDLVGLGPLVKVIFGAVIMATLWLASTQNQISNQGAAIQEQAEQIKQIRLDQKESLERYGEWREDTSKKLERLLTLAEEKK